MSVVLTGIVLFLVVIVGDLASLVVRGWFNHGF
jgi:hypothetical protein